MDLNLTVSLIEKNLRGYFIIEEPKIIYEAALYSLFAGGKRLRPLLLLLTAKALGCQEEEALPFACAIEMIHTYSLIHDDLPCMDNDDLRRGKPTNHIVYGNAIAMLAGDALLNRAYEVMAEYCTTAYAGKNSANALHEIASAAGIKGMIGGQIADMLAEGNNTDSAALLFIERNKTAALIKAAVKAGARLAYSTEKIIYELDNFSDAFGIAFQIQDDILDVSAETDVIGKPAGSDAKNNKLTYVSCFGLDKAKEDCKNLFEQAFSSLDRAGLAKSELKKYAETLIDRRF